MSDIKDYSRGDSGLLFAGTTSRRGLLGGAALAAAGAALAPLVASAQDAANPDLWRSDYWAMKGDKVRLAMYRKRVGAPMAGEAPKPVLFLVHGSSSAGLSNFDLNVPGAGEYSLMNVFARLGYDVWTMDFEGYGRSTVTEGNSDIKSGVADLAAATDVIRRETGQQKVHLWGQSSGALRAGAFAGEYPDRAGRLVLGSLTYTGRGSPTLADRAKRVDFYRTHNRRPRDIESLRSIFTRDHAGTGDPRVAEAMAEAEAPYGETVPTGTYLDMTANLPVVDPTKIQSPVMVVRGQWDGIAIDEDVLDFYQKLPNPDRQFAILPGLAHSLHLGINRHVTWHVVNAFLSMPEPIAIPS
jgi:pimeloyl-ACP methyl ester carboxylesterase